MSPKFPEEKFPDPYKSAKDPYKPPRRGPKSREDVSIGFSRQVPPPEAKKKSSLSPEQMYEKKMQRNILIKEYDRAVATDNKKAEAAAVKKIAKLNQELDIKNPPDGINLIPQGF